MYNIVILGNNFYSTDSELNHEYWVYSSKHLDTQVIKMWNYRIVASPWIEPEGNSVFNKRCISFVVQCNPFQSVVTPEIQNRSSHGKHFNMPTNEYTFKVGDPKVYRVYIQWSFYYNSFPMAIKYSLHTVSTERFCHTLKLIHNHNHPVHTHVESTNNKSILPWFVLSRAQAPT